MAFKCFYMVIEGVNIKDFFLNYLMCGISQLISYMNTISFLCSLGELLWIAKYTTRKIEIRNGQFGL